MTILTGNVTTTYNEHKHKNTETNDLVHPSENLLLDFLLKHESDFPSQLVLIKYITKFLPVLT